MGKVIAICGKVCSGKTFYANKIKDKENAVILSCDEQTKHTITSHFDNLLSEIKDNLLLKSLEILKNNKNVILDWGFWTKSDRQKIIKFYLDNQIKLEWHYILVSDLSLNKNIEKRNKLVSDGKSDDYYVDEGLKQKCLSVWENPDEIKFDVTINN